MESKKKKKKNLAELSLIIKDAYGVNLGVYSKHFLQKRVEHLSSKLEIEPLDLIDLIKNDAQYAKDFVLSIPVIVSEFFRDPVFYSSLAQEASAWLATFPRINVWSVGCAHGEEAISMALWLSRMGLSERSTIYATDYSKPAIDRALSGFYDDIALQQGEKNYMKFCGENNFRKFYKDGIFDSEITKQILFLEHNMLEDQVFCEAQIILCRNVLIYYDQKTQFKTLSLLCESLDTDGILCLGSSEHVPNDWQKKLRLKRLSCSGKVYRRY